MNDRAAIFQAVKDALAPLTEKTPLPEWDAELPVCTQMKASATDLATHFIQKLRDQGGVFFENTQQMADLLRAENALRGYCDPFHVERFRKDPAFAGITFETAFDATRVDDCQFGITWASYGIAESGTLVFKDSETSDRLGALAPWIHIALLNPAHIQRAVLDAILKHGNDPSVIWATGPSKTADVEGILIQGVHGPGIQACLFI